MVKTTRTYATGPGRSNPPAVILVVNAGSTSLKLSLVAEDGAAKTVGSFAEVDAAPEAVATWVESLAPAYTAAERSALQDAFDLAHARTGDARMPDGEAALDRAVGTATILAALGLDRDSVIAALLLPLPIANAFDHAALAQDRGIGGSDQLLSAAGEQWGWRECRSACVAGEG